MYYKKKFLIENEKLKSEKWEIFLGIMSFRPVTRLRGVPFEN